ncbi:MAG TPA: hypothetical protein VKC54_02600 [Patescibacteria group bacterium]|nr:hypothetical protein [Patescibacteria group bacterium]
MNPEIPTLTPEEINQKMELPEAKIKNNHWITVLSMAAFVLLSLGVVAFLYYQNQQLKSMIANYQATPTATPTNTPIESATPTPTCKPRPACLDAKPRCLIPETNDMCPKATPTPTPIAKACTMEAKLCPNGSYVGRTGPNCEFAPCPY